MHSAVADELRQRGVTRSANNPAGDFAENLFCRAFGWVQAPSSMKSADAIDGNGIRFQIKCRRITAQNTSRQLSALRSLEDFGFDILAAVLFNKDYSVLRAALIPYAIVVSEAKHQTHTNSGRFMLRDAVWNLPGVEDVTHKLRIAAKEWATGESRS
jgi:hypothetical protein